MEIQITGKGVYGADGEIAIGTVVEVKEEPKGLKGRYTVLGKTAGKKKLVVNPELEELKKQADELGIEYNGNSTANSIQKAIDAKLAE